MHKSWLEEQILALWYTADPGFARRLLVLLLSPLSFLTKIFVKRRLSRRKILLPKTNQPMVVVVGNLTTGGTGKTPVIEKLALEIIKRGITVGIVSRGYGRTNTANDKQVLQVSRLSKADEVGDEPKQLYDALLLALGKLEQSVQPEVPIAICSQRQLAVNYLAQKENLQLILSDDGLQHYGMARHYEILVIDGERCFGNSRLLPAGPLREPLSRLSTVNQVLVNSGSTVDLNNPLEIQRFKGKLKESTTSSVNLKQAPIIFAIKTSRLRALNPAAKALCASEGFEVESSQQPDFLDALSSERRIIELLHCLFATHNGDCLLLAGIGNPRRFFSEFERILSLAAKETRDFPMPGKVRHTVFPDHHRYSPADFLSLNLMHGSVLVMTAKDAIKCARLIETLQQPVFALDIEARFERQDWIDELIEQRYLQVAQ